MNLIALSQPYLWTSFTNSLAMKRYRILFLILLMPSFVYVANAQTSGVHTEYHKDYKETKVETSLLYLSNTPNQFTGLMLLSWFKGEKLIKVPTSVELRIYSLSRIPLYQKGKDRSLVFVIDDQEWALGKVYASIYKGKTKNGVDTFVSVEDDRRIKSAWEVSAPRDAEIRSGGNLYGVFMELISQDLNIEPFLKISKSAAFQIRLGSSSFTLTERQMNIIRNFVRQTTVPDK
jgi:hypothetical protein